MKRQPKPRQLTPEEMVREVERLVGHDLTMFKWGDGCTGGCNVEYQDECATLVCLYTDGGPVAHQLVAELQRVAVVFNGIAAKVQARVFQDAMKAERAKVA